MDKILKLLIKNFQSLTALLLLFGGLNGNTSIVLFAAGMVLAEQLLSNGVQYE